MIPVTIEGAVTLLACYLGFCLLCCGLLVALTRRDRRRELDADDGMRTGGVTVRAPGRTPSGQPAR